MTLRSCTRRFYPSDTSTPRHASAPPTGTPPSPALLNAWTIARSMNDLSVSVTARTLSRHESLPSRALARLGCGSNGSLQARIYRVHGPRPGPHVRGLRDEERAQDAVLHQHRTLQDRGRAGPPRPLLRR